MTAGVQAVDDGRVRCPWGTSTESYVAYHDHEWGVPEWDSRRLFEFVVLEGAQAGLSWLTILNKRPGYRRIFHDFDVARVAAFTDADIERALGTPASSATARRSTRPVGNARAWLELDDPVAHLWLFVDGQPVQNAWPSMAEVPVATTAAEAMSKDLKKRGFRFVGPTICYSLMQACGLVNDHVVRASVTPSSVDEPDRQRERQRARR